MEIERGTQGIFAGTDATINNEQRVENCVVGRGAVLVRESQHLLLKFVRG
jgi:hypothetical protein